MKFYYVPTIFSLICFGMLIANEEQPSIKNVDESGVMVDQSSNAPEASAYLDECGNRGELKSCDACFENPSVLKCDRYNAWSIDVGGQYTWMSFTTPPTFKGNTGGVIGKLTYEKPWDFFGQLRTIYNLGPLKSSVNRSRFNEWYLELAGGYCFPLWRKWTFTPYVGVGFDYIHDNHSAYSTVSSIQLRYQTYYAIAGFDTHYTWKYWKLGAQFDCLPIFNQYLKIKTLTGEAWTMDRRVGFDGRLPIAWKIPVDTEIWLELAPYYRFFPIGDSDVLGLPNRNLNQWGAFFTFRFFM